MLIRFCCIDRNEWNISCSIKCVAIKKDFKCSKQSFVASVIGTECMRLIYVVHCVDIYLNICASESVNCLLRVANSNKRYVSWVCLIDVRKYRPLRCIGVLKLINHHQAVLVGNRSSQVLGNSVISIQCVCNHSHHVVIGNDLGVIAAPVNFRNNLFHKIGNKRSLFGVLNLSVVGK